MTLKDNLKKVWLSELLTPVLIGGVLITFFVSRDGLLLSYLKVSGWLIFIASLISTILLIKKIKKWCLSNGKNTFWLGITYIPTFFVFLYVIHTFSDYALRKTGYPDYVLFPCSFEPQTASQIVEAKNFWKIGALDKFNCDSESRNEGY